MTTRSPLHLMNEVVLVQRATTSTDNAGTPTRTWQTHLASLRAAIQSRDVGTGPSSQTVRRFTLFTPVEADVVAGDRILWQGLTLEVTLVKTPGSFVPFRKILVQEIL